MCNNKSEKWDRAAVDYQRVFSLGVNDYNAGLLRFWHETGMLFPGCRVLDIGCGVGKYGTYLAALGYDVILTDISAGMLRHAAENMAQFQTPWAVYQRDFNDVSGAEPVFAGGFDLVLSTMSPAVHDAATVRKMSSLSRGWCFLARFREWEQPFRDALMLRMGLDPRLQFEDLEGDVNSMIRSVEEAGFTPSVKTVDYRWMDRRTPEEMAGYLCRNYFPEEEAVDSLREAALRCARDMANEDGFLEDGVNAKVAWIFWRTDC